MITIQEALAATDPALPDDQRLKRAQAIMAGVAANDAYINSRTELEQAILQAKGGQAPLPHAVVEAQAQSAVQEPANKAAGSIDTTVVDDAQAALEDGKAVLKVAEEEFPGEAAALKARLKELTGGVL